MQLHKRNFVGELNERRSRETTLTYHRLLTRVRNSSDVSMLRAIGEVEELGPASGETSNSKLYFEPH